MRDTYFTVHDLTEKEKEELKATLYWAEDDDPYKSELDKKTRDLVDRAKCAEEIPDWVLEKAFGDISFVDEDFWCNV